MRSDGEAQGLLNGPDDRDYEVRFQFSVSRKAHDGKLYIHEFRLRDETPHFRAKKLAAGEAPPAPESDLVGSSFSIDVGETVVVGSSKLNGNGKALLVLLTVIP